MVVIFDLLNNCFNSTWISSLKLWSTFESGSSRRSKSGLETNDLANDALWASPALISWGYLFKIFLRFRKFIISFGFLFLFFLFFFQSQLKYFFQHYNEEINYFLEKQVKYYDPQVQYVFYLMI